MLVPTLALWTVAAASAATPDLPVVDLEVFTAWRADVRAAVDGVRARCEVSEPDAGVSFSLRLHVLPDGALAGGPEPYAAPADPATQHVAYYWIGPLGTHYMPSERERARPAAARFVACFNAGLADLDLAPPPGGRGVQLEYRVTTPTPPSLRRSVPASGYDSPQFDPPITGSPEVQIAAAAEIWRHEDRVFACLPPQSPPVSVTWLVGLGGYVTRVSRVSAWLSEERRRCIESQVYQWQLPDVTTSTRSYLVRYTFDPAVAAPIGAPRAVDGSMATPEPAPTPTPVPVMNLDALVGWRAEIRAAVEQRWSACEAQNPDSSGSFRLHLHVLPDGDRGAASATITDDTSPRAACLQAGLNAAPLPPPPGARGVNVEYVLGSAAPGGPPTPEGLNPVSPPRFDPITVEAIELKLAYIRVIWSAEDQVFACLPPAGPPVPATWTVTPGGAVAEVRGLPEGLTPEQRSCVERQISGLPFPRRAAELGAYEVRYGFDPGVRAPIGVIGP